MGMMADPSSDEDGVFSTIPRSVEDFFLVEGNYNATAFLDNQQEKEGFTIFLQYDGKQVSEVPKAILAIQDISDQTVNEGKTLSFEARAQSSISGIVWSLEKNPPSGAEINSSTGHFTWTPDSSHGNVQGISYTFDIVAAVGVQVDRETITIKVIEPKVANEEPTPELEPTPAPTPELEPKVNDEPIGLAPFVDPNKDPQSYVDRYNSEPKYKEWFDKTFPDMTIYEAVGLDAPEIKEPEIEECGPGTKLTNGKCIIVENPKEGGGCLIATAAYGSEMAPQIQFLREIRDNKVMSTESGASFMTGFNEFYYSFSPHVADYERENPLFKEMVKIGITPMLTSLSIMSFADSEEEIVGYGIGVILMNIGMYVAAPAMMMFYGINKIKKAKF